MKNFKYTNLAPCGKSIFDRKIPQKFNLKPGATVKENVFPHPYNDIVLQPVIINKTEDRGISEIEVEGSKRIVDGLVENIWGDGEDEKDTPRPTCTENCPVCEGESRIPDSEGGTKPCPCIDCRSDFNKIENDILSIVWNYKEMNAFIALELKDKIVEYLKNGALPTPPLQKGKER
jgi:hypothetical protein